MSCTGEAPGRSIAAAGASEAEIGVVIVTCSSPEAQCATAEAPHPQVQQEALGVS